MAGRPRANGEVVQEGTTGDQMYVLSSGRVTVERHGASIAELGAGGFFGECGRERS